MSVNVNIKIYKNYFRFHERFYNYLSTRGIVKMIKTENLDFYHKRFSNYCLHLYCYIHNVLADMSSNILQVFVKLGNLHGTSNYALY